MRLRIVLSGLLAVLALPALAGVPSLATIAAALRENRPIDAERIATDLLAADPNPADRALLLMDRGLARETLGKRQAATVDFSAAIHSNALSRGDLVRALFDRGVVLDELGQTDAAIADYSKALTLEPHYATALNNRANAYRRLSMFELARTDYRAAAAAGDDEPEYPLYGLGRVAEEQGDPGMAKNYYRQALAANAQFTSAKERLIALRNVSDDVSYSLHAPTDMTPDTQALHQPKLAAPAPHPTGGDVNLRPTILDAGAAAKRKPTTARVASVAPLEFTGTPGAGDVVQLGAWHNQASAALGWNKLAVGASSVLNGVSPHIMEADVPGKGHYWRLRAQTPAGTSGTALCEQIKAKGFACIVAKS